MASSRGKISSTKPFVKEEKEDMNTENLQQFDEEEEFDAECGDSYADNVGGFSVMETQSVSGGSCTNHESSIEEDYMDYENIRGPFSREEDAAHKSLSSCSSEEEMDDKPNWEQDYAPDLIRKSFKQFKFDRPYGPNIEVDICSPKSIFLNLFTVQFLNHIVDQANLYARQMGVILNLDLPELMAFFGILIIMGFHKLPSIRLYWSSKENFRVQRIADVMTLKRFLIILRFLHLNDNSKAASRGTPQFDKFYKIRPLLRHVSETFAQSFHPSRNLSIDESIIGLKGRANLKQYIPIKPNRRGFKVWAICCSVSGFMLGFEICLDKSTDGNKNFLSEFIVITLSYAFQYLGYILFFDSSVSSYTLINKLLMRGLFACGTILPTSKFFPKDLKNVKHLKFGEHVSRGVEDVSVTVWQDRGLNTVNVISSMAQPRKNVPVKRRNKFGNWEVVNCPDPIAQCNKYLGGVDHFDQLMTSYFIQWKSRRWWVNIFFYFLDAAIVNSFILYTTTVKLLKTNQKLQSHLLFRDKLANELIGEYSRSKNPPSVVITKYQKGVRKRFFNVGEHVPTKGTFRQCVQCSTRKNVKRTNIICKVCDVALCKTCFAPFHREKKS